MSPILCLAAALPNYATLLTFAAPETIVVVAALIVLGIDLGFMRGEALATRRIIGAAITSFGCLAAIFWMLSVDQHANLLNGMLVVDPLTRLVKMAILVLAIITAVISIESRFTTHIGEYFALLLMATVGMMFLVSSEEILMIFLALELTSLSLYILTAFNKRNVRSAEAALKYFLFGGTAAAFTLFGLSLLYGLSGATNLQQIAAALGGGALDPLLVVAIITVVIGFGFKVAAAPFHLWAPDAYEGAPTPSAAFIASGSKVASFVIFAKVMLLGFAGASGSGAWRHFVAGWVPLLSLLALASMVLGNLAAIAQSNVKRLLAYSAVAHAGYALLGVLAGSHAGMSSLLYYVITYGLTTVGAFAVVAVIEEAGGDGRLSDFAGLGRRSPVLSFCMLIFLLSLAGIPPLAGFFGKFYLFAAAAGGAKDLGLLWLVIVAVGMSAVSLYYYLQVLKQVYVVPAVPGARRLEVPFSSLAVIVLMALAVVALGCAPDLIVGKTLAAVQGLAF